MDVVTPEQARIAEEAGAVAVMALERVPADIRKEGGVARMSDPSMIKEIKASVTIPVMAKVRRGATRMGGAQWRPAAPRVRTSKGARRRMPRAAYRPRGARWINACGCCAFPPEQLARRTATSSRLPRASADARPALCAAPAPAPVAVRDRALPLSRARRHASATSSRRRSSRRSTSTTLTSPRCSPRRTRCITSTSTSSRSPSCAAAATSARRSAASPRALRWCVAAGRAPRPAHASAQRISQRGAEV